MHYFLNDFTLIYNKASHFTKSATNTETFIFPHNKTLRI